MDLADAIEQSVGIYSSAPTGYLSALARVPGFTLADLDEAIAARSLIRARTMRYSVYTLPPDLLALAVAATRTLATRTNPFRRRLAGDYLRLAAEVEQALAAGPLAATEIRRIVDPNKQLGNLFSILLGLMGAESRIVRATNLGGWRSNRLTYARWEDWVPGPAPAELDSETAQMVLAERYAAAYGPVTEADLRWWTGWSASESKAAAAGVDLSQQGNASDLLDGVRLLPVWDVLMVAYRDRSRLFPDALGPWYYDRLGNATSVVYDRGSIVGVWDLGKSDSPLAVKVAPTVKWSKRRWSEVEEQVQRIGAVIGSSDVSLQRDTEPVDLTTAKRNTFLAPLATM